MKKRIIAAICIIGILLLLAVPVGYAWLSDTLNTTPSITSYVHKSYFESGDGTSATQFAGSDLPSGEGCAYEIKYPVQLYYFAWLQAMGYFNVPKEGQTEIEQVYFYLSADLDMSDFVLPAIGTQTYPFVGNFDGNGHTITGLTVQNVDTAASGTTLTDRPTSITGAEIVGFFGVIGSLNNAGTVNAAIISGDVFVPTPNYTYSSQINEVKNFTVDGITVKTETSDALIGAIAGYVNGTVTGAAVSDSDLVVASGTGALAYTENLSDYALVGYCTDPYKFTLNVSKVTVAAPTETDNLIYKNIQNEGPGFGGSIQMERLFDRLDVIRSSLSSYTGTNNNRTYSTYPSKITVTVDEVAGGDPVTEVTETAGTIFRQRVYDSPAGSYSFGKYSQTAEGNSTDIMYLYGRNDDYTTEVTTVTKKNEFKNGFRITDGEHYLNLSAQHAIVSGTDEAAATVWVLENNRLFAYGADGNTYYLNAANAATPALSASTNGTTTWTRDGDSLYYSYTYRDASHWYLNYQNGWTAYPVKTTMHIANGTTYMNRNGTTGVSASAAADTEWIFDSANGRIYTYYNGYFYYLNASGSELSLSRTASTVWTRDGDSFYYTNGGRAWYLRHSGGWSAWPAETTYLIASGNNYLVRSGTNDVTVGNAAAASEWAFNASGNLYTLYNDTVYFLNGTSALTLSTGASTDWTRNDDGTLSYTYDNKTWYLRCTGTDWDVFPSDSAYTIGSGTHWLAVDNGALSAAQTAAAGTGWLLDGNKIYTVVGGTVYYLLGPTDGSTDLTLTTASGSATQWTYTLGGGTMSYTGGGKTWYLYDQNGAWKIYPAASVSFVSQNGQYLVADSANTVAGGTAAEASAWILDGGRLSTSYGGNTRYLNASGTAISLGASATTTWTHNNNGTLTAANGWYLVYDDGWKAYPSLSVSLITDGEGHYLTRSGTTGVTDANEANASRWFADGNKLFTLNGSTPYYLNATTGALSVTATAANGTEFAYNGTNKTLSFNSGAYYVIYNNGWTVGTSASPGMRISVTSGNTTYYLNGNAGGVSTGTSENGATLWTYNGTSGTVSTVVNGTTYYLRAALEQNNRRSSTNLTMTATAGDATTFAYAAGHLTCSLAGATYSLALDNAALKMVNTNTTYYTIYNSNQRQYLNANNTSLQGGNDATAATLWEFGAANFNPSGNSSVTTTVSTPVNGTVYYLSIGNGSVSLTTTSTNTQYYRYSSWGSATHYLRPDGANRYLRYNNGWTTRNSRNNADVITVAAVSFTQAAVDLTEVTYTTEKTSEAIEGTVVFTPANAATMTFASRAENLTLTFTEQNFADLVTDPVRVETVLEAAQTQVVTRSVTTVPADYPADTYIPLNVNGGTFNAENSSIEASGDNTGYIVSGSDYYNSDYPSRSGDIRVSEYAITNISTSLNSSNYTTYNETADSRLEVLTAVNHGSYSGFYRVSDDYNNANGSVSNSLSNRTKVSVTDLGLKRYADARASMSETFLNSQHIYGLHFMNASIDKNDCAVVPQAMINGDPITDLTVPRNCIDFFVKRRGFITVFAGTYFSGNTAFFSLHEIHRDQTTLEILEIKEISEIYAAAVGNNYIYRYTDGTYSSNAARGDLLFNMAWMTNPSVWVNNTVYYFEIPVNGGEFALGSVDNHTGAYLFYLDIAANGGLAEDKDRVTITEQFTEETYSVVLPKGVQLTETGSGYNSAKPYEFATMQLGASFSGTLPLNRTGNTVDYTDGAGKELTYIGGVLTVGSGGAPAQVYYPNGYNVRTLEHVVDYGRDTRNYFHILIETVDHYGTGGTRESRTVNVYGDPDSTLAQESWIGRDDSMTLLFTFSYDPTGHDGMTTRVVNSAAEGGYNVAFDEDVTLISATVSHENSHVNFGDNLADILITATHDAPLSARLVPAMDLSNAIGHNEENVYYASTVGPALAAYNTEYEGEGETLSLHTDVTMARLDPGSAAQSRTLTYAITLDTDSSEATVYGRRLIDSYTYTTKTFDAATATEIVNSGTVTVTVSGVTINGTALGTQTTEVAVGGN